MTTNHYQVQDSGPTILTLKLLMKTLGLEPTVTYEIFQTNASSHVKYHTTGKVQFLIFWRFLTLLTKCSFRGKEQGLYNNSMKVLIFSDIS